MAHVYSLTGKKISWPRLRTILACISARRSMPRSVSIGADCREETGRAWPSSFIAGPAPLWSNHVVARIRSWLVVPSQRYETHYPSRHLKHVRRTSPVFVEHHSQLRVVTTREINVRFKAKVTKSQRLKVLKNLNLTILAPNEFHPDHYLLVPTNDVDESEILDLANRLNECPEVEHAAPNFLSEHRKFESAERSAPVPSMAPEQRRTQRARSPAKM